MTRVTVHVSDHAVLRYLERVGGIDVEALRRQIAERVKLGAQLGANGVSVGGHTYVLVQSPGRAAVTTILPRPGALCMRGDPTP